MRRDYYDESLLYCLDDGEHLVEGPASGNEPVTAMLVDLPSESPTRAYRSDIGKATDAHLIHAASKRKTLIAGAAAILLVSALGLGSYFYYGRSDPRQIESLAVLPFENATGDSGLDYLSDGLSAPLIDKLSKLPQLKVSARASSFKFRGPAVDLNFKDIAGQLSVQALVVGKVTMVGDDLPN